MLIPHKTQLLYLNIVKMLALPVSWEWFTMSGTSNPVDFSLKWIVREWQPIRCGLSAVGGPKFCRNTLRRGKYLAFLVRISSSDCRRDIFHWYRILTLLIFLKRNLFLCFFSVVSLPWSVVKFIACIYYFFVRYLFFSDFLSCEDSSFPPRGTVFSYVNGYTFLLTIWSKMLKLA